MLGELKNCEIQNPEFPGMALGQVFQYLKPNERVQLVLNYQLQLRENNYVVSEVLAIVDREEGGMEALRKENVELKCLFSIKDFIQ